MEDHGMRHKVGRIVGMTVLGVLGAVFLGLVLGYLVEYLWNWLMPSIFGVGKIGYWQAFGLIILAKLLFGGMGHHGSHHDHKPRHLQHDWPKCGYHSKEDGQQWDRYDEWWQKEGKTSFETYRETRTREEEVE